MDVVRQPEQSSPTASSGSSPYSSAYIGYVLIMLMLINAVAYVDRSIITVLSQPIKNELGLTDTQLGFLTGFGFMIVYIFAGLPIARFSERSSRTNIISICISFWSVMTALCGIAGSYWQLLLCRIGVGAGESGAAPAAHSIIGDYVAPEKRGSAIGTFVLGNPLGIMLGSIVGGLVAQHFSWRAAFFVVGIPGLLLAILVKLTVREPKRGGADQIDVSKSETPSLMVTLKHLFSRPTYVHQTIGMTLAGITVTGVTAFLPALLIRRFDFPIAETGMIAGVLSGGVAALGTWAGGFLTDKLTKRDRRWFGWLPMIALGVSGPLFTLAIAQDDWRWLVAIMIAPFFLKAMHFAPVLSSYHNMTDPRMRATTVTISFIIANTLGAGGGPFIAGFLSDLFANGDFPGSYKAVCHAGSTSSWCVSASAYGITIATMIGAMAGVWAALHVWLASLTVNKDFLTPEAKEPTK
jgi:predicted MFS family arabinose efflux permease